MKTFIRTEREDGIVNCSWYDKNGRRYMNKLYAHHHEDLSIRETDNKYGYMGYAKLRGFAIVDDYEGKHPARMEDK